VEKAMNLVDLREKIDGLDDRIIRLLNLRFRYALRTRKLKKAARDPERERSILLRVRDRARPPADPEALSRIYRKILAESRRLQEKEKTYEDRHSRCGKDGDLAGPGARRGELRRRSRRPAG